MIAHTELTLESLIQSDPWWARAAALDAGRFLGLPSEALRRVRERTSGRELSERAWMRIVLDESDAFDEAA